MLDEFCPDCGTHRVALFRYCLTCGLDYDELDARGELPGGPYTPPWDGVSPKSRTTFATFPTSQVRRRRVRRRRRRVAEFLPVGIAALVAVAIVGVLAIGVGSGTLATAVVPSAPTAGEAVVAVPSASPVPADIANPVFAPTGPTTRGTVTNVIDGDTITVSVDGTEYRVRYVGIDAPALVNLDKPVQYMAQQAADANRRLVSSADVILERDTSETDAYGQLLRNVWVDEGGSLVLVGLELVKAGLARVDIAGPDQGYASEFSAAEGAARAAAIGIWSAPPLPMTGVAPSPLETALPRLVGVEPLSVFSSVAKSVRGGPGVYTWRSVRFSDPSIILRWDLRSSAIRLCQFDWHLESTTGAQAGGTLDVETNTHTTGSRTEAITFSDALLVITSTCPSWTFSMRGVRPS